MKETKTKIKMRDWELIKSTISEEGNSCWEKEKKII